MPANHVDIGRPNVAANDPSADIVKTSRSHAIMLMESEIESRSMHISCLSKTQTDITRQFGSMQDKVSDYEKILRDLQGRVSDADADLIRTTLDQVSKILNSKI